jgi:HAD superfamily hydrolase (TIGR01450 family)
VSRLIDQHDAVLLDLDGVVYRGAPAVPHAVESLTVTHDAGVKLGFVTNNAARPPQVVADQLAHLGLPCTARDVITSAQVGARMMADRVAPGSRVLAIGGPGVALALEQEGLHPVLTGEQGDMALARSVVGVLQGYGPDVRWHDLAVASYAVEAGAVWIATNTDRTIPRADGIAPGNGTLVDAVTTATGVVPPSAGKPEPAMMLAAAERLDSARPIFVGDRLDTDIRGAAAAGMVSLLVLTGVSTVVDLLDAGPVDRPTYVSADLRGLLQDLPRLDTAGATGDDGVAALVAQGWSSGRSDQLVEELTARLLDAGSR